MGEITRFILFIGPCSSIFDYTTYLIMLYVFKAAGIPAAHLFQTGWFVESLLTQTLIIHIIRTNRFRSCAAGPAGRSARWASWFCRACTGFSSS
jgi:magnesium-transporting ATPase (P-type)